MKAKKYLLKSTAMLLLLLLLHALPAQRVSAQTGKEFWFDIPEVNRGHVSSAEFFHVYLHVTALDATAKVRLELPAEPGFKPLNFTIPKSTKKRIELTDPNSASSNSNFTNINIPMSLFWQAQKWGKPDECPVADRAKYIENVLYWSSSDISGDKPYINRTNKGVHLQSDNLIMAYIEINVGWNMDLIALKGANALGRHFFVPMQSDRHSSDDRYDTLTCRQYPSFNIVATQDNTKIKIKVPRDIWLRQEVSGTAAKLASGNLGAMLPAGEHILWLNRGQSSIIAPLGGKDDDISNSNGYQTAISAGTRLGGAEVEVMIDEGSGGEIVVLSRDDIVISTHGNPDYVADQLVPVELAGKEFAVIRGIQTRSRLEEFVYVVGTEDGTKVNVSGYGESTIGKGEQLSFRMNKPGNEVMTVVSTKPVFTFHMTSCSEADGDQKGGALIPALPHVGSCIGSREVAFSRTRGGSYKFYMNLLVWDKPGDPDGSAMGKFRLLKESGQGFKRVTTTEEKKIEDYINKPKNWKALPLPAGVVSNSTLSNWKWLQVATDEVASNGTIQADAVAYQLINTRNVFHLGLLNGSGGQDNFYGYFSDFKQIDVSVLKVDTIMQGGKKLRVESGAAEICYGDSVRLEANASAYFNYRWEPAKYLNRTDTARVDAIGVVSTQPYTLYVTGMCDLVASTQIEVTVSPKISPTLETKPYVCGEGQLPFTLGGLQNVKKVKWMKKAPGDDKFYPLVLPGVGVGQSDGVENIADDQTELLRDFFLRYDDASGDTDPQVTTYSITMLNDGCVEVMERPITAFRQVPTPLIDVVDPPDRCSPVEFKFSDRKAADALPGSTYKWNFGSGKISSLQTPPPQIFTTKEEEEETIPISLVVTDKFKVCTAETNTTVKILPMPQPDFSVNPTLECEPYFPKVKNHTLGTPAYTWTLRKNGVDLLPLGTGNEADVSLVKDGLSSDGVATDYTIHLLTTKGECKNELEKSFTVLPKPTYDDVSAVIVGASKCSPVDVQLTVTGVTHASSYSWERRKITEKTYTALSVGGKVTGNIIQDVVTIDGGVENDETYEFRLTLRTDEGNCYEVAKTTLTIPAKLEPKILAESAGCPDENGNFTAVIANVSTAPSTTNYKWFVDGKYVPYDATTHMLTQVFENHDTKNPKLHTVELVAEHGQCKLPSQIEITVHPQARASFNAELIVPGSTTSKPLASNELVCPPASIKAVATGAAQYRWSINDNQAAYLEGEIIEHPLVNNSDDVQNLTIKLIGMNDAGCKATYSDIYRVAPSLDPTIIVKPEKECTPAVFHVSLAKTPPTGVGKPQWDFKGGGYEEPVGSGRVVYRNSGNYTIGVRLVDALSGCSANGLSQPFKVETGAVPKIGALTAKEKKGCSPLTIAFKNESTGASSFSWDFGDNENSTDPKAIVEHTFRNNGNAPVTYKVRLSAFNGSSCDESMVPDEVEITVYPSPKADMLANNPDKCRPGRFELTDLSKDADLSEWAFTPAIAQFGRAEKRPGKPGDPQVTVVTLVNTSENDPLEYTASFFTSKSWPQGPTCRDYIPEWKIVIPPAIVPEAKINGLDEVCSGQEVIFDDLSKGGDIIHTWDFNDGFSHNSERGEQVKHVFNNFGESDVTRNVTVTTKRKNDIKSECPEVRSYPVVVHPQVKASIEVTYGDRCVSPVEVTFTTVSDAPGMSHYWEFGDGQTYTSTQKTVKHEFVNPQADANAEFVVKVKSSQQHTSGMTCPGAGEQKVVIPPVLKPVISPVDQSFGCSPLTVNFDASKSTGGVNKYSWEFGDRNGAEGSQVSNTYTNTGMNSADVTYTAVLTVHNALNCTQTAEYDIVVHPAVKASFVFESTEPKKCTPFELQVKNSSINGTVFNWTLEGSSQTLAATGPGQSFKITLDNDDPDATKFYTLRLNGSTQHADGSICKDEYRSQIEVLPKLNPKFKVDIDEGCEPLTVTFTNESTGVGDGREIWIFGDGTTFNESDPSPHTFYSSDTENSRVFNVVLEATNKNGCEEKFSKSITVYPRVKPEFNVTPSDGCTPLEVEITNLNVSPAYNYFWTLGGGHPATSVASPGKLIYENPNDQAPDPQPEIISLKVALADHPECTKTISKQIQVSPRIIADFTTSGSGCHPLTLKITNTTKAAPGETRYDWTSSDGAIQVGENPTFELTNESREDPKEYTINLKATSVHKCVDFATKTIVVYPTPVAGFTLADNQSQGCAPFDLSLVDKAEGAGLSYFYDFGDGITKVGDLSGQTIDHQYANTESEPKSYAVSQTVTSAQGCKDVYTHNIYVFPQPIANFVVGPPGAGCSPFIVSMNNLSKNATSYVWTFQDGGTSTQENPTHRFVNPTDKDQVHSVKLVATSPYKCEASIEQNVTVYAAPEARFEVTPINQVFPASTVTVTNHSVPAVDQWNYTWEWGDDQVTQGRTPGPHVYDTWGRPENDFIIPIKLTVANNNCSSIAEKSVIIRAPKPATEFTANRTAGCPPLEVRMFNKSQYAESWEWHFDDGTVSTDPEPTHIFEEPGNYHVRLISRGDGGESYSYHIFEVYDRPFVDFRIEPQQMFLPDAEVQAMNMSAMAKSYRWEFGDGGTSVEESPVHVYQNPGFYDVTLTAYSNQGCAGSKTLSPAVEILGAGNLSFPNAFKPSESGPTGGQYEYRDMHNQIFHPFVEGSIQEYKLMIFNRWGEQIFESTDIAIGWDGYQNGKLCDMGVYAWRAVGLFFDGTEFDLRGNVTLMR